MILRQLDQICPQVQQIHRQHIKCRIIIFLLKKNFINSFPLSSTKPLLFPAVKQSIAKNILISQSIRFTWHTASNM